MQQDIEFHERLNDAAGNETLSKHLRVLQRQALLFWSQTAVERASFKGIIEDFSDTLRAVKVRDFGGCAGVLRRHVLDHVRQIQALMRPKERRRGVRQTSSVEMPAETLEASLGWPALLTPPQLEQKIPALTERSKIERTAPVDNDISRSRPKVY
jgi:hypothetical protein